MTILIGMKLDNTVILIGDCRRSITDNSGEFSQVKTDNIYKVHVINDSTILALGGTSIVVDLTLQKLKEKMNNNITTNQIMEICKESYDEALKKLFPETFRFFSIFFRKKRERSEKIYISFIVGGIDKKNSNPFLVHFESPDFLLSKSNSFVIGDGNVEVIDFINKNKNKPDAITCSAQAICETSKIEKKISPNSFGIAINDQYEIKKFEFNDDGRLKDNSIS